jgi:NAD(P)H-dependent FMN reductase
MKDTKTFLIIAISGSLKSNSSNTNILRNLAGLAPKNVEIRILEGLDALPHFNPDDKREIDSVNNFKEQLKHANGLIFSTPEYAFGVPGVLKNVLDWTVSTGELNEKPVIAISASPLPSGGDKALASLLHTLTALGASMSEGDSLSIAGLRTKMNESGEITDQATQAALQNLLNRLIGKISPN